MLFTRISARYKMLKNCSTKKKILSPNETLLPNLSEAA